MRLAKTWPDYRAPIIGDRVEAMGDWPVLQPVLMAAVWKKTSSNGDERLPVGKALFWVSCSRCHGSPIPEAR